MLALPWKQLFKSVKNARDDDNDRTLAVLTRALTILELFFNEEDDDESSSKEAPAKNQAQVP